MPRINTYSENTTVENDDKILTYDTQAGATKLTAFSTIWNWIVSKFHALTSSSAALTPSTDRVLMDKNGTLTRVEPQAVAKYGVETYNGTQLAGQAQSVKSAIDALNSKTIDNNAGGHNCIYRGKYLGTSVTAAQYTAIANGTFEDLFLGDYWTIGGNSYAIVDFDYYIRCGSVDVTRHHVVLMPVGNMNIPAGTALYGASGALSLLNGDDVTYKETATAFKWNATAAAPNTHTTAGGYKYSRMRTVIMKAANTIVVNAFGSSHILPITTLYYDPADATASGLASGWAWFDQDDQSSPKAKSICDLPNETQVYGQQVWGLGSAFGNVGYEIGIDKFQFSIFRVHRGFADYRGGWWLRSVSSASSAAFVNYDGFAGYGGSANALGVRPRFLLVG